jgi:hypothetical protein
VEVVYSVKVHSFIHIHSTFGFGARNMYTGNIDIPPH